MNAYSFDIGTNVGRSGVYLHMMTGEVVDVGGDRYIRQHSGRMMTRADDGWTECRHEAKRRAAARVQELANKLIIQADTLRREADLEQAASQEVPHAMA